MHKKRGCKAVQTTKWLMLLGLVRCLLYPDFDLNGGVLVATLFLFFEKNLELQFTDYF
jgi:hypothetical protein